MPAWPHLLLEARHVYEWKLQNTLFKHKPHTKVAELSFCFNFRLLFLSSKCQGFSFALQGLNCFTRVESEVIVTNCKAQNVLDGISPKLSHSYTPHTNNHNFWQATVSPLTNFFLSKGRRAQSPNVHFQLCSFNLDESVQEVKGLRHGGSHSSPGQIGQGLPKDSDMESSYGQQLSPQ